MDYEDLAGKETHPIVYAHTSGGKPRTNRAARGTVFRNLNRGEGYEIENDSEGTEYENLFEEDGIGYEIGEDELDQALADLQKLFRTEEEEEGEFDSHPLSPNHTDLFGFYQDVYGNTERRYALYKRAFKAAEGKSSEVDDMVLSIITMLASHDSYRKLMRDVLGYVDEEEIVVRIPRDSNHYDDALLAIMSLEKLKSDDGCLDIHALLRSIDSWLHYMDCYEAEDFAQYNKAVKYVNLKDSEAIEDYLGIRDLLEDPLIRECQNNESLYDAEEDDFEPVALTSDAVRMLNKLAEILCEG